MATTKEMTLHQKILKIADMAGVLQKSKSGYSYKYVPEEDIQAKVTAGLQKYGIMLYNSIVPGTLKVSPITYEKYDPKLKANKVRCIETGVVFDTMMEAAMSLGLKCSGSIHHAIHYPNGVAAGLHWEYVDN